ncbi:hypothetical protein [Clostridium botulinum]|nr:hypothetical protein [Clostridium botulinum]MCD3203446.1 hypothetical protein [Clostridium botulinum C/D]MCD3222309.1 hypothetical protein [Clostridium botulinum C/D]MCD3273082.1 hypothetical protein [Clostridium botulinum C/D]MCD3295355.1 hypothetical protein [Clostridium botulinum C/D]
MASYLIGRSLKTLFMYNECRKISETALYRYRYRYRYRYGFMISMIK